MNIIQKQTEYKICDSSVLTPFIVVSFIIYYLLFYLNFYLILVYILVVVINYCFIFLNGFNLFTVCFI